MINGRLVIVWYTASNDKVGKIRIAGAEKIRLQDGGKIYIWDEKRGLSQIVERGVYLLGNIRISGDGSKVFCMIEQSIQACAIQTGEVIGKVVLRNFPHVDPLCVDGSKIWVRCEGSSIQGWDFGISGSSPTPLPNTFPDRPHLSLDGRNTWKTGPIRIKDMVTRKEVFQMVGRYAKPTDIRWDGQYLVVGYESGDVLILDFKQAPLQ